MHKHQQVSKNSIQSVLNFLKVLGNQTLGTYMYDITQY